MNLLLGTGKLQIDFSFSIHDAIGKYKKTFERIGVYFSGGIDSTALLILILTELQLSNKIKETPITCFTIKKNDFAVDISDQLIKLLSKKFNTTIEHQNYIFNKSQENISISTFVELFRINRESIFFLGINRMPDDEIVQFKNKLKVDYGHRKDRFVYYSPFLFLHKPQIIDIFYKLGHEDILPYTYSCTMQPKIPCGNCYACEERAWGFKYLEKIDPLLTQNRLTE
jgi:hypothetical protein